VGTHIVTVADRPELVDEGIPSSEVWPEYNLHGEVTDRLWPRLYDDFPHLQFGVFDDDTGELLAEGHTIPCWWDGTDAGLASGVDETMLGAIDRHEDRGEVNTLCALAAEIPPRSRGQGLARTLLVAMGALAEGAGLEHLIAPVRPSMKDRYPITPIERYVTWRRDDGTLLDPWMRVVRVGGFPGALRPVRIRPRPHLLARGRSSCHRAPARVTAAPPS
jgi:hypothetical protein